jgi:hypothetical protein
MIHAWPRAYDLNTLSQYIGLGSGLPPIYGEILRAHRVVSGVGVGGVGRDDVRDPAEQSTGADP